MVWRGPELGIEPGTSRTRCQHSTTRLSRRRWLPLNRTLKKFEPNELKATGHMWIIVLKSTSLMSTSQNTWPNGINLTYSTALTWTPQKSWPELLIKWCPDIWSSTVLVINLYFVFSFLALLFTMHWFNNLWTVSVIEAGFYLQFWQEDPDLYGVRRSGRNKKEPTRYNIGVNIFV